MILIKNNLKNKFKEKTSLSNRVTSLVVFTHLHLQHTQTFLQTCLCHYEIFP